jgi:ABC-type uncharacterized transport system permease subunit
MTWFEAQRFKAYPAEIAASIFGRLAELTLYATFWLVVAQFATQGNINAQNIISYYLIISGLTSFFYSGYGIAGMTIDMVKSGELSQTLIKPINPILYPWAVRTGRNLINIGFGAVQVIVGLFLSGGMRAEALPFLIPVLFNTALLNAAFNIMLGATAFYLVDGRGLKNAFLHLSSFLRGERMPIYLMTPGFVHILMLTPFPASLYHLAILVQGTRLPEWGDVMVGSAWAVVLLWASVKFWQVGLKRYEAVGI